MLDGVRNFRIDYRVGIVIIVVTILAWIFVVRLTFGDAVEDFNQPVEAPR